MQFLLYHKTPKIAIENELDNLEFLTGIPGTVGGAVKMNAGAYGGEMKDIVVKTRYMTYDGKVKTITAEEHKFEYRNSIFSILISVVLAPLVHERVFNDFQRASASFLLLKPPSSTINLPSASLKM